METARHESEKSCHVLPLAFKRCCNKRGLNPEAGIKFICKEKRGNSELVFQAKLSFVIDSDKQNFKLNLEYTELATSEIKF